MEAAILDSVKRFLFMLIPLIISTGVHEYCHALSAYLLGDKTAKRMGRMTLNPIVHIDPFGLFVLMVTGLIGWAKPVPVDFYAIKQRFRFGQMIVAFAGPFGNLIMLFLSILLFKNFFVVFGWINDDAAFQLLQTELRYFVLLNATLFIFNLIPIPPLDGGRILENVMGKNYEPYFRKIEPYGMFIIIGLLLLGLGDVLNDLPIGLIKLFF